MSELFNADEIFEIAEQVERNGAKFYNRAAENIKDPDTRQILLKLAAAEVQHQKTFAAMREEILEQGQVATVDPDFDLQGEAALYLHAIADGQIFDTNLDIAETLTGKETIVEVLQMALGREKDAVIFYLGMKDMVSVGLGKDKIDHIIREEMEHVTIISKQLKKLGQ